jgi:hypothetical protein
MPQTFTSTAINTPDLLVEIVALSMRHPESFFTCNVVFGKASITEHTSKRVPNNYGEQCFEMFGGFFKNGKVVKPDSTWRRQYNYIPCGDR